VVILGHVCCEFTSCLESRRENAFCLGVALYLSRSGVLAFVSHTNLTDIYASHPATEAMITNLEGDATDMETKEIEVLGRVCPFPAENSTKNIGPAQSLGGVHIRKVELTSSDAPSLP
jgi:hypothetical protein